LLVGVESGAGGEAGVFCFGGFERGFGAGGVGEGDAACVELFLDRGAETGAACFGFFLLGALESPVLVEVGVADLLDFGLRGEVAVGVAEFGELRMTVVDCWVMARIRWWEGDESGNVKLVQTCTGV
jgi:hypothetical protein